MITARAASNYHYTLNSNKMGGGNDAIAGEGKSAHGIGGVGCDGAQAACKSLDLSAQIRY
jgi:hypothetical protein